MINIDPIYMRVSLYHKFKRFLWFFLLTSFLSIGFYLYASFPSSTVIRIIFSLFLLCFFAIYSDSRLALLIFPLLVILPTSFIEIGPYPKYVHSMINFTTYTIPDHFPYLSTNVYYGVGTVMEFIFLFYLLECSLKGRIKVPYKFLIIIIILFAGFSILVAKATTISVLTFMNLLLLFSVFLVYANITQMQELKKTYDFILVALILGLFPIIFSKGITSILSGKIYERGAGGFIGSPNTAAMLTVLAVPLTLGKLTQQKHIFGRFFFLLTLIGFLIILVKTGSRNGLLSTIIGAGIFTILSLKKIKKRNKAIILFSLGISTLILIFYMTHIPILKLRASKEFILKDPSVQIRLKVWREILASFVKDPFYIVGIGNFQYSDFNIGVQHAHNFFLHNLIEMGLPVALSFLLLFLLTIWNLFSTLRKVEPRIYEYQLGVALLASLSAAFFSFMLDMRYYTLFGIEFYFILLGISFAYFNLTLSSKE